MSRRPLIAHVLYRLDTGGMEQVVLDVINCTGQRYRHAVIALAGFGALRNRIGDADVACVSLDKKPGKDWGCYLRMWKALRQQKPDLVQTYNFGALDMAPIARLAGTRRVVHAEHGRDAADPHGDNRRYRLMRRWLQPCIDRYIVVSGDLESWLRNNVGIAPAKIVCIRNGIDTRRYIPADRSPKERRLLASFAPDGTFVIINVGRLDPVKDQTGLLSAFRKLCDSGTDAGEQLRLAIVGEGDERLHLERQIARLRLGDRVRLLGNREDVPALLAESDVFALSSVAEGIPLTVLEAMSAGLPVVATDVGGVGEVVADGATGVLVGPSDPAALAAALRRYIRDPNLRQEHGRAGRARVEACFSLPVMIAAYTALYDKLLGMRRQTQPASPSVKWAGRREH